MCVLLFAPVPGTDRRAGVRLDSPSCGGSLLVSWVLWCSDEERVDAAGMDVAYSTRCMHTVLELDWLPCDPVSVNFDPRMFPDSKRQEADR